MDNADQFRNVALVNKSRLKNKFFIIPVCGTEYKFKISGIGKQTIKIEKFFYYSDIINAVQEGNDAGFEFSIEQVIIDPSKNKIPVLDSATELRERAFANKQALKRMFIEKYVGTRKYEFKIAGIGGKAIKLELYVGYEEIANISNQGIKTSLEFILKELLVDNEIDYSIFDNIDFDDLDDVFENEDHVDELDRSNNVTIEKIPEIEAIEIISKIKGLQKLIFDAIDDIESDVFTVQDILEQDLIKAYAVQGKSFEPMIIKNINELIDLGIIAIGDNDNYYKLW